MFSTARLVERIREEYSAMPGLKLTREQVCRLWGVGHETCAAALDALLAEGFLHQTGTGKYVALPRRAGPPTVADQAAAWMRCPHCGKRQSLAAHAAGRAIAATVRCEGCQRVVSVTRRTA